MIFSLRGKIIYRGDNFLVIETGQIGYQVFVSPSLIKKVKINEGLKIFTYLYTREETQELYGFKSIEELEFFKELLAIAGVGPKIAQNILSLGKISEIKKAIQNGQVNFLTKISGVGKKTAEKIIVEMRGKFEELLKRSKISDRPLETALRKLGYHSQEIKEILSEIPPEIEGTKERLKYALKILGQS
ncbi:MAG: Holliday junction branch migration protein RuvA [Patescibacteria group bacterium]|nr:Holliday junction branch migration protein RuvA [Patescibacteria group bacterium]